MEQTTLPPLVSDQRIRDIETGKFASERMYEMNYQQGMKDMRDIYESARAEDAKLITKLRAEREKILEALEEVKASGLKMHEHCVLCASNTSDKALDDVCTEWRFSWYMLRTELAKHTPE
jgi:hypothetical protein